MHIETKGDWYEAGRWDAEHGLMPMSTWALGVSPVARTGYARGYRQGLRDRGGWVIIHANPYANAERPSE